VALVTLPVEGHSFRVAYGLAFRKPSAFESRFHIHLGDQYYNPSMPEIADLLANEMGNEKLDNENVHTVEAGWRAHLLEDHLELSADLFFSRFSHPIHFITEMHERFGAPDLRNSHIQFQNIDDDVRVYGAEAEVVYQPTQAWRVWLNLGLRKMTTTEKNHSMLDEPALKINAGARWLPGSGLVADLAMHYTSSYQQRQMFPDNIMARSYHAHMGDQLLLVGRLGYRVDTGPVGWEMGLTLRAPLTENRREFPGVAWPVWMQSDLTSDFGGERFERQASFDLRAAY
jgi:outer membrane receptor protein involved in Fe transport